MLEVLEMSRKVAPTNATVLITGESGTGKEALARSIHANSPRAQRIFVAVHCAALSPALIESELFGAQHQGRFERAHQGTLFLDEIGELDGNLQAKLLRVLQERTFERVGGTRQITADVRVMAATNRDLQGQVREGRFREDLYYRLSAFPLRIPPLRERRADIPELARFFLARAARNLRKPAPALSPEAECALAAYGFPGNVRELENMMERAVILCDLRVEREDLAIPGADGRRAAAVHAVEGHRAAGHRGSPAGEPRQPHARGETARHQPAHATIPLEGIRNAFRTAQSLDIDNVKVKCTQHVLHHEIGGYCCARASAAGAKLVIRHFGPGSR